jgi:hypothetical protein
MGNNITCSISFNQGTSATLYTLETWFVFGYIIVNILYKSDDDDDDDVDDDDDDNNDNNNNNNNSGNLRQNKIV